jgi:DNA topoisomerase-1
MSSTSLVIVESPAKCNKIEGYLGHGYKVIASFGHLRHISGLESIEVHNNFKTSYSVMEDPMKQKQIEKIRNEIGKAYEVIIATDDDREGEAIGWHICDLFGLPIATTKRIIFHEITETAIKTAIANPKHINMNLVQSQQARQILDLLVGFTISPILWNCISKRHDTSLSAGRCQTPALRLIYDNHLDIKKSPGRLIYDITGYFTTQNLVFELNKQFESEEKVTEFLEHCKTWEFIYSLTAPKKTLKKSPEPLTTSTLQQMASNELHMSPKETMKCAQELYEGGYITYMRTDSKKYSVDFVESARQFITSTYGHQYVSNVITSLTDELTKSKLTKKGIPPPQEAHEAIRPVNIAVTTTSYSKLSSKTSKLYEHIWKRTVETCMPSAQYSSLSAKLTAPLNTEFIYKSEQVVFLGWQIINKKDTDTEKDTNHYQFLQTLKQHVSMRFKQINAHFNLIEHKMHYTEAKLVQLLEDNGIGRPSTFASLVDKIQERKYVEKQNIAGTDISSTDFTLKDNIISKVVSSKTFGNEKNKLVIQPLGILVIEFLIDKFDMFFNYNYTKQMENTLDDISNGMFIWHDLCSDCYANLVNETNKLKDVQKFGLKIDDKHTLIIGKHGPVIKYNDNDIVKFIPVKKSIDIDQLKQTNKIIMDDIIDTDVMQKETIGKYKGQDLFIKKGKYGVYAQWGKETKSLKEEFKDLKIEDIVYMDVIKYLDKDTVLDPTKPVGLVRELNSHVSIRTGKYGDYIFYKKPRMKKPEFLKLSAFKGDYKQCNKQILLDWIKETYKVE